MSLTHFSRRNGYNIVIDAIQLTVSLDDAAQALGLDLAVFPASSMGTAAALGTEAYAGKAVQAVVSQPGSESRLSPHGLKDLGKFAYTHCALPTVLKSGHLQNVSHGPVTIIYAKDVAVLGM